MSAFRCLDGERIEKVPLPNTPAPSEIHLGEPLGAGRNRLGAAVARL